MKIAATLVSFLAAVFVLGSCAKGKDADDDDDDDDGWATETYVGNDLCIDVTASDEGDGDPSLAKFSSASYLGENAKAVAGGTCAAGCVGRCVDINGRYYTFTMHYYGPTHTAATAKADCEGTARVPTGGKPGIYSVACE